MLYNFSLQKKGGGGGGGNTGNGGQTGGKPAKEEAGKAKNGGDETKKGGGGGSITVVLKVDMHCNGCAKNVVKSVRGIEGERSKNLQLLIIFFSFFFPGRRWPSSSSFLSPIGC